MKAFYQLTLAQLRIFLRNRQALIWILLFPFFFMFIFGLLFQNDRATTYELSIVDLDKSPMSQQIKQSFQQQNLFKISTDQEIKTAQAKLEKGEIDLFIILPQNLATQLKEQQKTPASIEVYYSHQNAN